MDHKDQQQDWGNQEEYVNWQTYEEEFEEPEAEHYAREEKTKPILPSITPPAMQRRHNTRGDISRLYVLECIQRGIHVQTEIARRLGLTQGGVSQVLKRLEDEGYVRREQYVLTPMGQAMYIETKIRRGLKNGSKSRRSR